MTATSEAIERIGEQRRDATRSFDARSWMDVQRARVERVLDEVIPAEHVVPARLHAAMRYATLGGGKRVRALLVYAAARWAAGDDADAPAIDAAAAAVELIHAYSLVHDDLPCMDDDDLRRGRPSTHVAFDEATALLAGDALQTLAFDVLATRGERAAEQVALLAAASGSRGMAGGQAIDLESVGRKLAWPELEVMHAAKTGALLRASIVLGGAAVRRPGDAERAALDAFGVAIGLAFQVVDDILDVETDSATLGKTAGKDAANDKPTVVSVLGLDEARALARRLGADAHAALDTLGGDVAALRSIADLVVARRS